MLEPLLMSTLCCVCFFIMFFISMYIMCVILRLFSAFSHRMGALRISIIIKKH